MAPKQYLERERERIRAQIDQQVLEVLDGAQEAIYKKKNNTPCKKIDSLYSCPSYEVL